MKFCPHCGGDIAAYMEAEQGHSSPRRTIQGARRVKYNQDSTWRRIVAEGSAVRGTPPDAIQLVGTAVDQFKAGIKEGETVSSIVHVFVDRDIQPQGGMLYRATMLEGRMETSPEQLARMGYAVEDGKLVTVDDAPVSEAYMAIDYWGGEKQHKRWHMSERVTLNPSRNGNPFFMDDGMIAFGAKWKDCTKMEEALLELHGLLAEGVNKTRCIGIPLAIELAVH